MAYIMFYEFIESRVFSALLENYLDDDSYAQLQLHLIRHPHVGRVIRGSGGVRKIRWHLRDSGKSGGVRICYFVRSTMRRIYLLTIYAKNERETISTTVLNEIRKLIENAKKSQSNQ